jgi:ThiF family
MLVVRPQLHQLITVGESRTLKQLEALGVRPDDAQAAIHTTVSLHVPPAPAPARLLLARVCLDYVLRLEPLVTELHLTGLPEADLLELGERLPLEIEPGPPGGPADYSISVGAGGAADLVIDAAGWLACLGDVIDADTGGTLNPVGPQATAALAAGEVFKALFRLNYPNALYARRFTEARGVFSFFDYRYDGANAPLDSVELDAYLVGLGGVGAAVIRTLAELGEHLSGLLRLIDADTLGTDSLNRVTYARWQSAVNEHSKVKEAKDYLAHAAPNLEVEVHPLRFAEFKRTLARRRQDRSYNLIVTGLDDDGVRHEVQRELPRVLIDAATGHDANLTVERAILGEWGCLGCTRQGNAPAADGRCDVFPDERAPSISFVAGLAGTLAAGEVIKEAACEERALRGSFDHIFIYGPNPDLRHTAAQSCSCRVGCREESVRRAYRRKYAA